MVFDRHQERFIQFRAPAAVRSCPPLPINASTCFFPLLFAIHAAESRQTNHRHIVARILIGLQQLANLESTRSSNSGSIHCIALVERDNNDTVRRPTSQQPCSRVAPARLRTRRVALTALRSRHPSLRGSGDHVLDVVRVTSDNPRARSAVRRVSQSTWPVAIV